MKPYYVAELHRSLCIKAGCARVNAIDYSDPCSQCHHYPHHGCEPSSQHLPQAYPKSPGATAPPATWAEWHIRALAHDGSDDFVWVQDFLSRVPNITCDCRRHASEHIREHPPRWEDYFAWTVEFHNAVNKRLGRSLFSVAEASALWSR
jgi:hypothetical protein